jgi:limonene-1,2-epoxide hydrolase
MAPSNGAGTARSGGGVGAREQLLPRAPANARAASQNAKRLLTSHLPGARPPRLAREALERHPGSTVERTGLLGRVPSRTGTIARPETGDPMDNESIVREFIEAWSRLDPKELAGYFAEDGVYHNMPTGPVQGRENVEKMIAGFSASWTETNWEIVHLMGRDDVVIAERVDRTKLGDKSVDLPCTGVFELENGKIKVWRDYFDLGTYTRGIA